MSNDVIVEGWLGSGCLPMNGTGSSDRMGAGGPGVAEFPAFVSDYHQNGIVLNGVVLWMDIQTGETAFDIWKNQALARFTDDEIREAKRNLWMAAGSNLVKPIDRQGKNAKLKDIEDIADALT